MFAPLAFTSAAALMIAPELAPAPVAAALASPIGEVALVLALVLGAADIAARLLFPGRA